MPWAAKSSTARAKNAAQVAALLVGEDLGVREPAVVIDDGVDVVEPDPGLLLRRGRAHLAAMGSPAAAVGDPPDLLDVHVDQLAGPVAFVADRGGLRGSDHLAGHRVTLGQARHVVAAQDPAHGPGRHTELGAEPVLAPSMLGPSRQHQCFDLGTGPGRHPMRPRRPVATGRHRPRRRSGRPNDGRTGVTPPSPWPHERPACPRSRTRSHQQTPAMERQTSITVRHEDLRCV